MYWCGASDPFCNDSEWNKLGFLSMGENTEHVNSCEKLKAHFYTL